MKSLKLLALIVCASALVAGCASKKCCASKPACAGTAAKPACGMQCCADAKVDCAHCPKCSAKK